MDARGHIPYDGRSIPSTGMMRHGPFPGRLAPAVPHRPLEPLPHPEILENKIAAQGAEMERLLRENQRLAATHVALRQDLVMTHKEIQRIEAHAGNIQTEGDIQIQRLLEKIGKMESDIRAGEVVKEELQQAHIAAQGLLTARQELTAEIQHVTEELQKVRSDGKRLPELNAELDGLRQEHQKLRAAFEHQKGSNIEQVEQMHAMEKNLISLAREVEKLRAEVKNAEKGARAPNPYGGPAAYPVVGPSGGYMAGGYSHGHNYRSGYPNAAYGHGGHASYPQHYETSHVQIAGAPPAVGGASYTGGYGMPEPQMNGGAPVGAVANHYGGLGGMQQ